MINSNTLLNHLEMSQTSIILNVQQKLEDILAIQNVIVQNQHDMYDKLKDIEFRLVSVESRIPRSAQQMPSASTAKSGLLHPQMSSQRLSLMPLWQSLRVKREATESDEVTAKETEAEKRTTKRVRCEAEETEEGEVNADESAAARETEPGASSRCDEDPDEDSEADYDDDSTESSSTANVSYSQKSTPPPPSLALHRSSMPHSILQSLATSSLLSSLQPRHSDLTMLATNESTGTVYLDETEIRRIFATSKSRGNFSALLVQKLYSKDERVVSNVMGTRGKRQLSPSRMNAVRRLSFSLYPVGDEREEDTVWKKECVKAIDSKNRKVRTHHSVRGECSGAPPGGISASPSAGSLARSNPTRLLGNRPPFAMGLSPGHGSGATSANAFAIAMAAAAAAAVASSNTDKPSPKPHSDHPNS